jgi:soluble lytic murein transglycosylase
LLAVATALVVIAALLFVVIDKRLVVPEVSAKLFPIEYRADIERAADIYGIDPYLLAAMARTESRFDPEAVSRVGAVGIMQVMPDTAVWITGLERWQGDESPDLTDPRDSLELGACYISYLFERFNTDERAVVAAYNAGQGVVARWVSETGDGRLALEDIVYPETRAFVQRVEEWRETYRRVHPTAFDNGPAGR